MAMQTVGKALGALGFSPSLTEVFFINHEEEVSKAKFADHLAKHGISYDTDEEYQMRLSIFVDKDTEIQQINSSQNSFTVGHNHLSTLTVDEVNNMKGHTFKHDESLEKLPEEAELGSPASVNWVTAGKVNAVQNQGQCGSCWAFSSIAAIESANAIKTGALYKLSEQQLVDCDTYANGCNGGNYAPAFYYAMSKKITTESVYPYTAVKGSCQTSLAGQGSVGLSSYAAVTSKNIDQFKTALAKQPVGVAVDASSTVFQQYTGGIVDSTACGQSIDHAVTAVGYGNENGQDYTLIRNSWGSYWGDNGYIKLSLNSQDICAVLLQPYYPTI